ncbi:ArsA family ATPase [Halorussus gelatinilyticus]|uniref:ArsA family ATPase n=1 Tax=Halorussus gelatinilyticus TaxID=2937524 RepID=A0A8U0INY8_9EURY|nr:ArsA family ATPase [Halorussus gelatinilyticus]UPW01729.1 ArsA family ATPase [Halorussus gelatinilyticus]
MEKFVFYGGKGGVGKTTVSSAYALTCARAGLRTLLVSTDPAHSTSDVFDQSFDDDPRRVEGDENLWVMEIDPEEEVDDHMQEIRRRMSDQVSAGIVNEIDRQIELAHRTPGAHEAALFDRFIEVMRDSDEYDRVVFDTSPTGGTLRLLSLPEFLGDWIDRLVQKRTKSIDLFEKAAIGEREARRKLESDPIVQHLKRRKEKFEFARETLRNDAAFFLVMNPDELSIRETDRAVESLREYGLEVDGLVVNGVTPDPDEDDRGRGGRYLRERVATERERIDHIREAFDQPVVAVIESRVEEVKGDLLADVAAELDVEVEREPPRA